MRRPAPRFALGFVIRRSCRCKNRQRTAEFAGGGAAIGAIIGAIAGGGKGAAIGAGAGAGAGALGEIVTKGKIKVPAETILTFKLDSALRVVEAQ